MNKPLRGYGMGYKPYGGRRRKSWPMALLCLLLAALAVFAALELHIALRGRGHLPEEGKEPGIMVVFGCQVLPDKRPSQTLRDRLDTALTYLDDHPDMTVVVAGGQGKDEPISEARCMYNYLRERGFEGTIYLEDQSENTRQNFSYTVATLQFNGYNTESSALSSELLAVSSGFHLARIEMLARNGWGVKLYTLPAPVTYRPAAVRNFFREPLALVKSWLVDR